MQGWIKLYRELGDKPIWLESTPEQKVILITLLMMANHDSKEWEWMGKPYKAEAGQFVTSLQKIAAKSGKGISIQNVRTALKRFEKYDFLTDESTKVNRLITIVNWGLYQGSGDRTNKATNSQLTDDQQSANSQLTTNKNVRTKEGKNERIKDNVELKPDPIPYKEIIDYLNQKTGKAFKHTATGHKKLVKARWNEGYREEDFLKAIDNKCEDWLNDPHWSQYLQPSTLFGNKFDQYLNQQSKNVKRIPEKSDEEKMLDELSRQRLANITIPEDFELPF